MAWQLPTGKFLSKMRYMAGQVPDLENMPKKNLKLKANVAFSVSMSSGADAVSQSPTNQNKC
jgi:hypothetical protein